MSVNSPELFSGLFRVRVRVKVRVRVRITIKFYISGFTCSVMKPKNVISSVNPRLWFLTLIQYSTRQVMKGKGALAG